MYEQNGLCYEETERKKVTGITQIGQLSSVKTIIIIISIKIKS